MYNPLQTYTREELAELMHCSEKRVTDWLTSGIIRGIKTGKSIVFTSQEIQRFQADQLGRDISTLISVTKGERI